jgi:hypothetical protein
MAWKEAIRFRSALRTWVGPGGGKRPFRTDALLGIRPLWGTDLAHLAKRSGHWDCADVGERGGVVGLGSLRGMETGPILGTACFVCTFGFLS